MSAATTSQQAGQDRSVASMMGQLNLQGGPQAVPGGMGMPQMQPAPMPMQNGVDPQLLQMQMANQVMAKVRSF